jgi:hypothetical protein
MSTSNRLYTLLKLGKESNFKQAIFHSPEFCCILSKKADLVDGKVPLDQLPAGLGLINFYDNFTALNTALPQPQSVDMIAAVRNSQGTSWLPGSLGGTFYPKGYYRSTGVTWEFFGDFSYQATLVDVNLGVNNDQFVTPYTLANAAQWNTKNAAIQFENGGVPLGLIGNVDEIDFTGLLTATRVGNKVTVNASGSSGSTAEGVVNTYTAGEILSGGVAVIMDTDAKVYKMDINNSYHWDKYIGITTQAAIANDPINVITCGVTTLLGSGWAPGTPYYISSTGVLSTTNPAPGFCKQVGVGINTDMINIVNYSEFVLI